jgi:hypothetical protein
MLKTLAPGCSQSSSLWLAYLLHELVERLEEAAGLRSPGPRRDENGIERLR